MWLILYRHKECRISNFWKKNWLLKFDLNGYIDRKREISHNIPSLIKLSNGPIGLMAPPGYGGVRGSTKIYIYTHTHTHIYIFDVQHIVRWKFWGGTDPQEERIRKLFSKMALQLSILFSPIMINCKPTTP